MPKIFFYKHLKIHVILLRRIYRYTAAATTIQYPTHVL